MKAFLGNRRLSRLMGGFMAFLIVMSCLPSAVRAETVYEFSDQPTSFKVEGAGMYVSGNHLVWEGEDPNWNTPIFYLNLSTGETRRITSHSSPAQDAVVAEAEPGRAVVVWADKRNHDDPEHPNFYWDIYMYDLSTDTETKVNSRDGENRNPSFDGRYVVWHQSPDETLFLYDLKTGKETIVGTGRFPVVKNGKIVYKSAKDGGLMMYDIAAQKETRILELPYHQYVELFDFNGKTVVWRQSDLDHRTKFAMKDVTDPQAAPVDLTPASKKETEYMKLTVGEHYAAWVENVNGVAQIRGADLTNAKTFSSSFGTRDQLDPLMVGDKLILRDENGQLLFRTIIRHEVKPRSGSGKFTGTVDRVEMSVGPDGGVLNAGNGTVSLTILPGTFNEKTRVILERRDADDAGEALPENMKRMGAVWNISAERAFGKRPLLSLAYDRSALTGEQANKLGIYRFDPSKASWNYSGGDADGASDARITAAIDGTGEYALFLYEPTFADIRRHWAKPYVETLAARWIVHGMSEGRFEPDGTLTRAQFTAMLAGALRLEAKPAERVSFRDVPVTHWANAAIEAAAQAGWVQGYQGAFRPDEPITREQMMVLIVHAAGWEKKARNLSEDEIREILRPFKDAGQISPWARPYAAVAVEQGIITGSGGFLNPKGVSTRAQAAAVTFQLLFEGGRGE